MVQDITLTVVSVKIDMLFRLQYDNRTMINGKSKDVFYTIGAASNVNALDLECDNASIKMNSVCTLTESAKEKITLDLTGGSTLIFNNNPTIVIEQVKASNIKKYVAEGK